jgi:magnesium chelatase family protein
MESAAAVVDEDIQLEEKQAEIARLAASGGHSLLLAGPQGTGKSTLARIIHRLRPSPSISDVCEIETWSGESVRPLVEPHHTASELAMVGGRQPPRPGAITRAHCGTLLLDEVLLFRPEVQEALREPLETGVVHLARGPESRKFPADFQLIGTTNLCECGLYTPTNSKDRCVCPSRVRSKFESRLRGPFVDRFQMMAYTERWEPAQGRISMSQIREEIARTDEFQKSRGRENGNRRWRPNAHATVREQRLFAALPKDGSERRRLSTQRVARTFADIDGRDEIGELDIFRAKEWSLVSFAALKAMMTNSSMS